MCIQSTWADALIIQAVADALNVTIQILESNQGFAPLTTVYPVQERNTSSTITIGHIDECHYVSITALQSNASISMCNELTNDTQSSINYVHICSLFLCHQIIHLLGFFNTRGLTISMQSRVPLGPGKFHVVVLVRIKADPNYLDRLNWFRRRS